MIGAHVAPASTLLYIASPQNEAYRMLVFWGSISISVAPLACDTASFKSVQVTAPSFDSQIPNREWIGGVVRRAPPRPRSTVA